MQLEDLGLIGNCQYSALVANTGEIVWCCLPRFDSEPIFASLLDARDGGRFAVGAHDGRAGSQRYLDNTNVLETTFRTDGGSFRLIDFAPRFVQYDRTFRPTQIIRIIEPIEGSPRVRVLCEPVRGWSKSPATALPGSNHVQYEGFESPLRLTTDIPLSYLNGQPFTLTARRHLALTWGTPIEQALAPLCDRFLQSTIRYWHQWVKRCNIPPMFQREVIRSALALKLHCFDDTGAIIAAMTTSIPESPGSGRTWDYRYCWLRDAYYVLEAFRLLGHFEERESFIQYLLNIAGNDATQALAPLYRVDGGTDLEERVLENWAGYHDNGPVRIGNAAALQVQHDIYGEMVLALAPVFLDDRFSDERSRATLDLVLRLTRQAIRVAGTPDTGIWELRTSPLPQTFSSLMSWAAADRAAGIAERHAPLLVPEFREAAARIHNEIVTHAWSEKLGAFAAGYGGVDLDASVLEMASLRFLPSDSPKLASTIDAIQRGLGDNGWLLRYRSDDGFGTPTVAFTLCTFWLVEALATIGRIGDAREILQRICRASSPLGLLSEDMDTRTQRMWGNFPQAYSHVGLIHAAFAASPRWTDVL